MTISTPSDIAGMAGVPTNLATRYVAPYWNSPIPEGFHRETEYNPNTGAYIIYFVRDSPAPKSYQPVGIDTQVTPETISPKIVEAMVSQRPEEIRPPLPGELGYHATAERPGGIAESIFQPKPGEFGYHATAFRPQGLGYEPYVTIGDTTIYQKTTSLRPESIYDPKYGKMIREDLARQPSILSVPEFRKISAGIRTEETVTYPIYQKAEAIKERLYSFARTIEPKTGDPASLLRVTSPYIIRSVGNVAEFTGMLPAGTERIIRQPAILPSALVAGTIMQVGGIAEQAKIAPGQLVSDIVVFGAVGRVGFGAAGKIGTRVSSEFSIPKLKEFTISETAILPRSRSPWEKIPTMRESLAKKGLEISREQKDYGQIFREQEAGIKGIELATSQRMVLLQEASMIIKTYPTTHATLYPETIKIKPIVIQKPVKPVVESVFLTKPLSYAEQMKIRAANIEYANIGYVTPQVQKSGVKYVTPQVQKYKYNQVQKSGFVPVLVPFQVYAQPQIQIQKAVQKLVTPQIQVPVSVQVYKQITKQFPVSIQIPKLAVKTIERPTERQKTIKREIPVRITPPKIRPLDRLIPKPKTYKSPSALRITKTKGKSKLGKFLELARVASTKRILTGRF